MKRLNELDFAAPRARITPWAAVALCCALLTGAFVASEWSRVDQLRGDVEQAERRIEQRKRATEREQRRQKTMTPEQRRIERVLAEQRMSANGSGLSVVDWIEHAWTPQIALKSLTVDKAGREARIEGGAADLSHVYIFVDRLNDRHPDRKIGLLQHRTKAEDGRNIFHFSLSIEHP
ncbi:hypothetical protein WK05_03610 [Burkholderia ubonensis]|uniref:hypothetical protein n=1 Tax=Burkholderia ubonensis TaxID=101571 RepID=UPI00075EAD3B|nr:hypothetical protein [Burkholderia ubonensis]KVO01418.1 hypothetical protein WJ71_20805 [Burkholderia ubonensis]KVO25472.1 hypothetical protein WJ74_30745 [Burkholderia ubonensis]KVQ79416.1 hypothetical protein WK05_03610 [Burkholderia ubonensis]KVT91561.1 hypothetical protein WK59_00415 [Burkholderia ubonensis]KVU40353.1 hypothetical protein WK68_00580 [Burkholderia ubonensis]